MNNIPTTGLPGFDAARATLKANGITVTANYAQGGYNIINTVTGQHEDGVGFFAVIQMAKQYEPKKEQPQ
jgi:hypothetical protein